MLAAAGNDSLVLDLAGLTFLDSAAVHLLFRLVKRFHDSGRQLVFVVPADSPANRVVQVIDLAAPVVATSEDAVRLLADCVARDRRGRLSRRRPAVVAGRSRLSLRGPGAGASGAKQREQRRLLGVEVEAAGAHDPEGAGPEVGQGAAVGVRVDDGGRYVRGPGDAGVFPSRSPTRRATAAITRFASASLRGWSYSASATAADKVPPQVRKSFALNSGPGGRARTR